VGATCLLCAPALFNGLPLLYSDSLEYMRSGDDVVSRLLGGPDTGAYGQRSILYSALIFLLHGNRTLWPVVAGNALVATYAIWLTARAVIPGFGPGRLMLLIAALTALTALPWVTSCVMPDVFAGVLILVLFLLGFATPPQRRWQRASLVLIGSLSIVVHPSHLLLAAAVSAGVSILQRLLGLPARQRFATAGALVATLALAVAATLSTSWLVRGKATLTGPRPPYLLARVIGDGTGRRFLEESCDRLDLAICAFADSLPSTSAGFLWSEDGPMQRATPGQARRIRREELAVVKGTLKAHPWEQLAASASNTARQLLRFGLQDFATSHSYVERTVPAIAPSPVDAYEHSRQRTRRLAWRRIDRVQRAFVAGSAVFCLLLISLRRVRRPWPSRQRRALVALAATSLVGVLANAAIAGTLSGPYHRYGARVIWLLPLVSALAGLALWRPRLRASNGAGRANA
jgi:hypothetical protein